MGLKADAPKQPTYQFPSMSQPATTFMDAPFEFSPPFIPNVSTSPPPVPSYKSQRAKEKHGQREKALGTPSQTATFSPLSSTPILPFSSPPSRTQVNSPEKSSDLLGPSLIPSFTFGSPVGLTQTPTTTPSKSGFEKHVLDFGSPSEKEATTGFTGFSASNFSFDFGVDVDDSKLNERNGEQKSGFAK